MRDPSSNHLLHMDPMMPVDLFVMCNDASARGGQGCSIVIKIPIELGICRHARINSVFSQEIQRYCRLR
jgi:hypothetical protein